MIIKKSCFNCKHLNAWDYPATREEPAESAWDCKNEDPATFVFLEALDVDYTDPEKDNQLAELWAADCPGYVFKDWEGERKRECEADADYYDSMIEPTPEELAAWDEQMALAQQEKYIALGLLRPDGSPTNEYYRQSDLAYDCARESRR